jgi:hypothetical protein
LVENDNRVKLKTKYMKPTVLISDFLGSITFPHFTKCKEDGGVLTASVVYDADSPLQDGDFVTHLPLNKNTRVFRVSKREDVRKAKGDWSFRKGATMFCKITANQVGFWNPIKDHAEGGEVSPEYITDKKAAA